MFNPGDQVKFFGSIMGLNVTMTVRYIVSVRADGEVTYQCCYQDDTHTIQNIQALGSELTLIP